jgi:hypothetical protein
LLVLTTGSLWSRRVAKSVSERESWNLLTLEQPPGATRNTQRLGTNSKHVVWRVPPDGDVPPWLRRSSATGIRGSRIRRWRVCASWLRSAGASQQHSGFLFGRHNQCVGVWAAQRKCLCLWGLRGRVRTSLGIRNGREREDGACFDTSCHSPRATPSQQSWL